MKNRIFAGLEADESLHPIESKDIVSITVDLTENTDLVSEIKQAEELANNYEAVVININNESQTLEEEKQISFENADKSTLKMIQLSVNRLNRVLGMEGSIYEIKSTALESDTANRNTIIAALEAKEGLLNTAWEKAKEMFQKLKVFVLRAIQKAVVYFNRLTPKAESMIKELDKLGDQTTTTEYTDEDKKKIVDKFAAYLYLNDGLKNLGDFSLTNDSGVFDIKKGLIKIEEITDSKIKEKTGVIGKLSLLEYKGKNITLINTIGNVMDIFSNKTKIDNIKPEGIVTYTLDETDIAKVEKTINKVYDKKDIKKLLEVVISIGNGIKSHSNNGEANIKEVEKMLASKTREDILNKIGLDFSKLDNVNIDSIISKRTAIIPQVLLKDTSNYINMANNMLWLCGLTMKYYK